MDEVTLKGALQDLIDDEDNVLIDITENGVHKAPFEVVLNHFTNYNNLDECVNAPGGWGETMQKWINDGRFK